MSGNTAPLEERWSINGIAMIGAGVTFALVLGPVAITVAGDPMLGAYAAASVWFVALGYESQLIPQLKWEIRRRVRPTTVLEDGGKDAVQNPRIQSLLACGYCDEEWDWSFRADQEQYEIECPGCGATWTAEAGDRE